VEEAGAGFAAAIVLASKFRGEEIGSLPALRDAGIEASSMGIQAKKSTAQIDWVAAVALTRSIRQTMEQQFHGWKEMPVFKRQWIFRDFKKGAGMPVEQWIDNLSRLEVALGNRAPGAIPPLDRLSGYYGHMQELLKGYERDPAKMEEQMSIIDSWRKEVDALSAMLHSL
jgi:hypothetical protein